MLKAGALYFAIVIALLLGILSAMLILYTQLQFQEKNYYRTASSLLQNVESGIDLLSSDFVSDEFKDGKSFKLFEDVNDSIFGKRMNWGIYSVIAVKAFKGRQSSSKSILLGYAADSNKLNLALYLADNNLPLGYGGRASINGNVFLPKSGSREIFIDRKGFVGIHFIDGKIESSKSDLPNLSENLNRSLQQISSQPISGHDSVVKQYTNNYSRSFLEPTVVLQFSGKTILSQVSYTGNIKVVCNQEIIISKNCQLQDVLIIAPKITIQEGLEGSMQLFAKDSVIIEPHVNLRYPSAIYSFNDASDKNENSIFIGEESMIVGEVYCLSKQKKNDNDIYISHNATIAGLVYSDGKLLHLGTIKGLVLCNKFYLKTASSIYDNQLTDGIINRRELNEVFLFSGLYNTTMRAKWIKVLR